jgi:predicted NBD/HSP70 family sugar kinase
MQAARLHLLSEEKRLLWHLRAKGPLPRTELALALQVSNSALTKLSHKLLGMGLVEERPAVDAPSRGRPTIPLGIAAQGGFAAGATVHKGVLEIALVDFAGGVIALATEQVGAPDPAEFAAILEERVHALCVRHRLLGMRFLGIGVGVPGPSMSRDGERWHTVKELPGWGGVPLRQMLNDALGATVLLENDAKAAALAEYYLNGGVGKASTVVVIVLGYGIGAGVIEDGRLLKGEFGGAGEVGRLYPGELPRPTTLDLLSMLREAGCPIDSVARFDALAGGYEHVVESWIERAAGQLEALVNGAIAWFDTDDIVFSSPLPAAVLARLATRLNALPLRWPEQRPRGQVRVSTLGGSAIALGAALLPIHAATALVFP